jgi:antirestriction protein ArdC
MDAHKQNKTAKQEKTKMKFDAYQTITDQIINLMETHGTDWVKPWIGNGGSSKRPVSISTGKPYQGCNPLLLWAAGFSDHRWGTYKAWQDKGCQVRAGEKAGAHIVFFKTLDVKDRDSGEDKTIPFLRMTAVFNADQVDGAEPLPLNVQESPAQADDRVNAALAFARNTGAIVNVLAGSDRAYYSPTTDKIVVPAITDFVGTATSSAQEAYAGVILHELIHWTGHRSRFDRIKHTEFGDQEYATEELVAELGATFLCADLEISAEPRPDHAQYLASWLKALKGDKRLIVRAASAASKAATFLHGLQPNAQQDAEDFAEAA